VLDFAAERDDYTDLSPLRGQEQAMIRVNQEQWRVVGQSD